MSKAVFTPLWGVHRPHEERTFFTLDTLNFFKQVSVLQKSGRKVTQLEGTELPLKWRAAWDWRPWLFPEEGWGRAEPRGRAPGLTEHPRPGDDQPHQMPWRLFSQPVFSSLFDCI